MYRVLTGVSIAAGIAYLLTGPWQPFSGSVWLKGMAMAPLAALAFALVQKHGRPLAYLGIALALSCAGDVLLDLDPSFFTFGLAAFLLAHVEYATLWLMFRPRPFRTTPQRSVVALIVIIAAVALGSWLAPGLGPLAAPVALYIFAITTMVVSATISRFPSGVVLGAVLFFVSDSVLAIDKFKVHVPGRGWIVWSTYYFGQLLIALTATRVLSRDTLRAGGPNVRHLTTHAS